MASKEDGTMFGPRSLYVPLRGDVAEALLTLSLREYRHPKEQAAFLVAEGLRRAGLLEDAEPDQVTNRVAGEVAA